jgi:hypothetical protein
MSDKTEVEMVCDFVMNNFIKLIGCYALVFALLIGSIFYGASQAYEIMQGKVEKVEGK